MNCVGSLEKAHVKSVRCLQLGKHRMRRRNGRHRSWSQQESQSACALYFKTVSSGYGVNAISMKMGSSDGSGATTGISHQNGLSIMKSGGFGVRSARKGLALQEGKTVFEGEKTTSSKIRMDKQ